MNTVTNATVNDEIAWQIIQLVKDSIVDVLKERNEAVEAAQLFKLTGEKTSYVKGNLFLGAIIEVEGFNVLENVSRQFGQALNFLLDEKKISAQYMESGVNHFHTGTIPVVNSDLASDVAVIVSLA